MGLKDLFLVSDDQKQEEVKVAPKQAATSFPTAQPTFPSSAPVTSFPTSAPAFTPQVQDEHINKFVEKYQATFDGLNQTGYDFYEFFNAIIKTGGADNLQMYQMALSMATAMDASITKEKLISQADFYINELNKVYNQFVNDGNTKKANLVSQKDAEKQSLTSDLTSLNQQLLSIQSQISEKQAALSGIESKYSQPIADVASKLIANDSAKTDLLNKISKVKNNLSQI